MKLNSQIQKYSIEALVIVASILLAFGIDAAWENREEKIVEFRILQSMRDDIESNLQALKLTIETETSRLQVSNTFMALDPSLEIDDPRWEEIPAFSMMWDVNTFDPFLASLSSDNLRYIEDVGMRTDLQYWLGLVIDLDELREMQINDAQTLSRVSIGSGAMLRVNEEFLPKEPHIQIPSRAQVIRELRNNDEFVGELLRFNWSRRILARKAITLGAATEDILGKLNVYISQH